MRLDSGKFLLHIGEVLEGVACAPIPIARIMLISLYFVQNGMQPVRRRITFMALGDSVRTLSPIVERKCNGVQEIFAVCHVSHPLARR